MVLFICCWMTNMALVFFIYCVQRVIIMIWFNFTLYASDVYSLGTKWHQIKLLVYLWQRNISRSNKFRNMFKVPQFPECIQHALTHVLCKSVSSYKKFSRICAIWDALRTIYCVNVTLYWMARFNKFRIIWE